SFASSLEHLGKVDSYVLHGPSQRRGLSAIDKEAWRAMEELQVPHLGISNVALDQLEELVRFAKVKPAFVQNRCYARTRWDAAVRAFCRAHGVIYQGFSLLTANLAELRSPRFRAIVTRVGGTPAQIIFRFALQAGMLPLTGTTDPRHMREDLAVTDFALDAKDVADIESIAL
ncbi:MAG: aldo/keto reductase, partial [Thermoanaerobaculia bacterium]